MTSITLGGTTFSSSYDLLDRATDLNVKRSSVVIFDQLRIFDAAGNVKTANTTLPWAPTTRPCATTSRIG